MVTPLPLTVKWFDGETALSLAHRLAHANFVSHMPSFSEDTGLNLNDLVAGGREAVGHLAHLVGIDPVLLTTTTLLKSGPGGYLANGNWIPESMSCRASVRCCPQCLLDGDPYLRFWWLIEPRRICIEHCLPHIQLVQRSSPRHRDPYQIVWEFEDRLREMAATMTTSPAHAGEHYLHGRLRGRTKEPNWLDELDFAGAAKAMDVFGAVAEYGKNVQMGRLSQAELSLAASTGYDILSGGKASIWQFFTGLLNDPELNPNAGMQEILGAIWRWLACTKMPSFEPIKDLIREFCRENIALKPTDMLLGQEVGKQKIYSIVTAMKAHDIDRRTARKLLTSAGLVSKDDKRVERLITIDAEAADAILGKYVESISSNAVEGYLNMPTRHRVALTAAGHLKPAHSSGKRQYFLKQHLDDFLEKISARSVPMNESRQQVSIAELAQYDLRCTAPKVVDMIISGDLEWIGRSADVPGYASIFVDYAEVRQALDGNSLLRVPKSTWVTQFGSNERLVNYAIKAMDVELIYEVSPISNQTVQYISTNEIDRIRRTYISLRDVARAGRMHWRTAKIQLEKKGIQPIPAKHPKLFIYRRAEVG